MLRSTPSTAGRPAPPRPWKLDAQPAGLEARSRSRVTRGPPPACRRRPGRRSSRRSSGTTWSHSSNRCGQRGWNVQPDGSSRGSGGSPGSPAGAYRAAGSPIRGNDAGQRARVGVQRVAEHLVGRAVLDHPAGVHHGDPVAHVGQHRQVVADHQHPDAELARPARAARRSTWACTITSSAVVGSSATISRGPQASAIAIITRCRCPPESWCGYARARAGRQPDLVEQLADPARRPPCRTASARAAGSARRSGRRPAGPG